MPTVGLVGVGLIGRAWANVFSRSGWDVRIWDPEPKALAAAPALIAQSLQDVARHGLAKDPVAAAKRVRSAASIEDAVQGTELVIESGPGSRSTCSRISMRRLRRARSSRRRPRPSSPRASPRS